MHMIQSGLFVETLYVNGGPRENLKKNSRVTKRKLESQVRGPRRKGPGRSTADPLHYRCVTLINRKSTTVQTLGPEHAGPGPTSAKMMPNGMHRQAHVC